MPSTKVEAVDSFLATMSGAVVHDPEDAASGLVGLLAHDVADESLRRESTHAQPLSGGLDRAARSAVSAASPDARFLLGRDHEITGTKWGTLPNALIEVQDGTGTSRNVGITREHPVSMLPRAESVGAETTPQRSAADFSDEAFRNNVLAVSSWTGVPAAAQGGEETRKQAP